MNEELEKEGGALALANRMFPSVWTRVMGDNEGPVSLEKEPRLPSSEKVQSEPREVATQTVGDVSPAMWGEWSQDFPATGAVPFLGSGSGGHLNFLQESHQKEQQSRQMYRALGQRAGGLPARQFSLMAAENLRAMKRLAAACFLISGIRPVVAEGGSVPMQSYLHMLRKRFILEQQTASSYLAAAAESVDPWLHRLFSELAEEKFDHARRLCALVEAL